MLLLRLSRLWIFAIKEMKLRSIISFKIQFINYSSVGLSPYDSARRLSSQLPTNNVMLFKK